MRSRNRYGITAEVIAAAPTEAVWSSLPASAVRGSRSDVAGISPVLGEVRMWSGQATEAAVAAALRPCLWSFAGAVWHAGIDVAQRELHDNVPMESFWGSLKNELIHHQRYATRAQAEVSIQEYIEIFITASGVTLVLATSPPLGLLNNSTENCGPHKTRVSTIDSTPQIKLFFLALRNISKKWTLPIRDRQAALSRFYYPVR